MAAIGLITDSILARTGSSRDSGSGRHRCLGFFFEVGVDEDFAPNPKPFWLEVWALEVSSGSQNPSTRNLLRQRYLA